jgi:2'-5' RNA ligase
VNAEREVSDSPPDTLRLFIAIELPSEVKARLADLQSRLVTGSRFVDAHPRWVPIENLHLTVLFLGATPISWVEHVQAAMDEKLAWIKSFEITVSKLTLFPPDSKNPKVLSLDVSSPGKALQQVHESLYKGLEANYELETRLYRPHLTLARLPSVKSASRIAPLVTSHSSMMNFKFPANEVVLMESQPGPHGPIYKVLHRTVLSV